MSETVQSTVTSSTTEPIPTNRLKRTLLVVGATAATIAAAGAVYLKIRDAESEDEVLEDVTIETLSDLENPQS